MAKGQMARQADKKRLIAKTRSYVKSVMKFNKKSIHATARAFRLNKSIVHRLLNKTLTYAPLNVLAEMERAKERSRRAYYKMPDPKQKLCDETVVRMFLDDNARQRKFLEDLLKGS